MVLAPVMAPATDRLSAPVIAPDEYTLAVVVTALFVTPATPSVLESSSVVPVAAPFNLSVVPVAAPERASVFTVDAPDTWTLLPAVTVVGGRVGHLFAGTIIVEIIFGWPGIGRLLLTAIQSRDHPVLLGLFLLIAFTVVVANLITDFVYTLLDPRITYA